MDRPLRYLKSWSNSRRMMMDGALEGMRFLQQRGNGLGKRVSVARVVLVLIGDPDEIANERRNVLQMLSTKQAA